MAKAERPVHGKIVYPEKRIDNRIDELAQQLDATFDVDEILMVGLLTGATRFIHDLLRGVTKIRPKANPAYDFLRTSNYAGGVRAPEPRLISDLSSLTEVAGRDVVLVDEMSDSGGSNRLAKAHLHDLGAASVQEWVLVNRVYVPKENNPDVSGFDYEDWKYLYGRGLDGPGAGYGGGRAWPFIAECIDQPEAPKNDGFA